jgi:hypothetical protein
MVEVTGNIVDDVGKRLVSKLLVVVAVGKIVPDDAVKVPVGNRVPAVVGMVLIDDVVGEVVHTTF